MAKKVNINISTPVGNLNIYSDPVQQLKAEKLIESVPDILKKGYELGSEEFGKKLLKVVKKSLNTGMPPPGSKVSWPKHAASTIKRYGEHTLLNLTGQYAKSVTLVKQKHRVYVGLPYNVSKKKQSGKTSKRTLNQIALMLEYGSKDGSLPPRPLWTPAYNSVGGSEALEKSIVNALRKEIRKYT